MYHIPTGVEIHRYTTDIKQRLKYGEKDSSGHEKITTTADSYFTEEDVLPFENVIEGFLILRLPLSCLPWTCIAVLKEFLQ